MVGVLFKKKKNIFKIYLHWVFVAARGIFDFHCSSGIFTRSTWDLVPLAGIKPGPPALGLQNLSHWTTREVPVGIFSESWILLLVMYMILGCLSTALTGSFKAQTFHSEASKFSFFTRRRLETALPGEISGWVVFP